MIVVVVDEFTYIGQFFHGSNFRAVFFFAFYRISSTTSTTNVFKAFVYAGFLVVDSFKNHRIHIDYIDYKLNFKKEKSGIFQPPFIF